MIKNTKGIQLWHKIKPVAIFVVLFTINILLIRWFGIRIMYVLMAGFTIYNIYRQRNIIQRNTFKQNLRYFAELLLPVGVLIVLLELYAVKGVLGFFVFVLCLSLIRLYKLRKEFKVTMGKIETMIWGKSLDRTNWDKGELKSTKFDREIVWSDKNGKP